MRDLMQQLDEAILGRNKSIRDAISIERALDDFRKYVEAAAWNTWYDIKEYITIGPRGLEIGTLQEEADDIDAIELKITDQNPNLQISYVHGNLYIMSSVIKNLEGIFTPDCVFDKCQLMIKNNKNLISTKGLPKSMKEVNLIIKENSPKIVFEDIPPVYQAHLLR